MDFRKQLADTRVFIRGNRRRFIFPLAIAVGILFLLSVSPFLDEHMGTATFVLVVVTGCYVYLVRKTVQEMESQRLSSALPIVFAEWGTRKLEVEGPPVVWQELVIENQGPGTALAVYVSHCSSWDKVLYPKLSAMRGTKRHDRIPILCPALRPGDKQVCDLIACPDAESPPEATVLIEYKDVYGRDVLTYHTVGTEKYDFALEVDGVIVLDTRSGT